MVFFGTVQWKSLFLQFRASHWIECNPGEMFVKLCSVALPSSNHFKCSVSSSTSLRPGGAGGVVPPKPEGLRNRVPLVYILVQGQEKIFTAPAVRRREQIHSSASLFQAGPQGLDEAHHLGGRWPSLLSLLNQMSISSRNRCAWKYY